MAYARHGAKSPEWWKHLRWAKRVYWRRVRAGIGRAIAEYA